MGFFFRSSMISADSKLTEDQSKELEKYLTLREHEREHRHGMSVYNNIDHRRI
jgi:hypothetical protein